VGIIFDGNIQLLPWRFRLASRRAAAAGAVLLAAPVEYDPSARGRDRIRAAGLVAVDRDCSVVGVEQRRRLAPGGWVSLALIEFGSRRPDRSHTASRADRLGIGRSVYQE
jgi:hypothetical protein